MRQGRIQQNRQVPESIWYLRAGRPLALPSRPGLVFSEPHSAVSAFRFPCSCRPPEPNQDPPMVLADALESLDQSGRRNRGDAIEETQRNSGICADASDSPPASYSTHTAPLRPLLAHPRKSAIDGSIPRQPLRGLQQANRHKLPGRSSPSTFTTMEINYEVSNGMAQAKFARADPRASMGSQSDPMRPRSALVCEGQRPLVRALGFCDTGLTIKQG
jgi:hypothetical protein